ncbi:MAG: rhomboid family intramembrane serine protease [Reichenbachiella sp.]
MWLLFTFQFFTEIDLGFLGVYPREISGFIGVFFSPLIHGNISHILSNTFPLLFLGTTIFVFYPKVATWVFVNCYLLTGLLVWIFGRSFYHIGASGLIYGLAFFLILLGFFRKDRKSLLISIIIVLLYGGMIYGILPDNSDVSWESHLFGAAVGGGLAFFYRFSNKLD